MNKPKISICIPVYNTARYIAECVESLMAQSMHELEFIFVNDGSTDNSLEILEKYAKKDKRIKIHTQLNTGLGGARNKGMSYAKGDYIGFVDSDDVVHRDMYKELYAHAVKVNADMAMCDLEIFPEGVKKNKWYTPYEGEISGDFLHRNTQPWNKIVKKSLIEKMNFQFYEKNGDGMYITLMLSANNIVSINKPLYLYRAGHSSMSTSYNIDNFIISLQCCQKQIDIMMNTPYSKDEDILKYFDFRFIYVLMQILYVSVLLKDKKNYNKYKQVLKNKRMVDNRYVRNFLKKEYGSLRYLGMITVLPNTYRLSRLMVKVSKA